MYWGGRYGLEKVVVAEGSTGKLASGKVNESFFVDAIKGVGVAAIKEPRVEAAGVAGGGGQNSTL